MLPEEKFMFDLEGYLVVRGVLSPAEVSHLNALADEVWPGEYGDKGMRSTSPVSRWGHGFPQPDRPSKTGSLPVGALGTEVPLGPRLQHFYAR